jgi:Chitobiase/beta-hexosaminidase C-terminal domain/Legume lectin domain
MSLFARRALVWISFCVSAVSLSAQTPTPVPVLTWRYDLTHAGQNTSETALTPANVNPTTFGKLFSLSVDSTVYAQPLYVPGLKMSDGLVHNVLFVATENDSVYAFDADSNGGANANPIWHISLLTAAYGAGAGATAVPWADTGSPDVAPTVGITGTPTINPATNTIYLVANTKENGAYFSRLHALNIITGAEQAHSPVNITATVAGTGNGSSNGQLEFSALWENQRTALNYYNGYVYFGYGAHGDNGPWHGWLFAYNATTLAQSAVLCLSPNNYGSGIWASGAGMPIDQDATGGRMFLVTGNGTHSTFPPFNANTEFGESVVNFNLANGLLTPTDAFTSFNFQTLNDHDLDQGSGGVLMVPDQQGTHPHILVTAGKEGRILVLNRDNLGGYVASAGPTNTNALQDISGQFTGGFWNTAAYWNGNVYVWADNDVAKLFKLNSGVMDTTPSSQASIASEFPSPSFSISSDGASNGIAWAERNDQFNTNGPGVLYAWDANDLTTPIYESDTNSTRDAGGPANKFSIPLVTNGKVYVAANGEVGVYGLLNGEPTAAPPVFTPSGGTFSASQSVQLSSTTGSAEIYYTLDGTTPTPSSTLYSGPVTINADTTVKAIASAPGYIQSSVSSATFTFTYQAPPVTFSPAAGTYLTAQSVSIKDTDASAKIYYTTDGSTPSASSTLYSGPVPVTASETIKAIAIDPSLQNSNVGTSAYVIQNGGTSINFGSGFSSPAGLTFNGSAKATNDTRLQLTDGGLNEAGSVFWNAPINIQAFTTNFEFQLSNAQGNGFTFTIQNVGTTALGGPSAGLGYQDILKSVAVKFNFYNYTNPTSGASSGSNATGIYTNGQPPLAPYVDLTPSGIQLASDDSIQAQIVYDGANLTLNLLDLVTNDKFTMTQAINIPQKVGGNTAYVGFTGGTGGLSSSQKLLTWTYATQALPPTFAPPAGPYNAVQNVALKSGTTDAVIYYTTDGSTPTGHSNKYASPIAVATTETISAIAISPTLGTSNVAAAAYTLTIPTFSLSGSAINPFTPGASATSNITITPSGGFTGSVALTCAVFNGPTGATASPTCTVSQPSPISGTQAVASTLTINSSATTTPGTYTAIVTGTSGTVTQTTSVAITVNTPPPPPSFALTSTPVSIASPGATGTSTITVAPSGGFTGSVTLACAITNSPSGAVDAPTCSAQPASISGTQSVSSTLTINTKATTTPGTYTANVTGSAGTLTQTTSVAITISTPPPPPSFALTSTAVSIASPGASGTSTITVTPTGGFTGSVTLACAIASSPAGAIDPPTCSVAQPGAISGAQPVTSMLTINTTKVSTAALHNPFERMLKLGGGGTVVALLFFCLPLRRRKWQTLLGLLLFAFVAIAASGCGGKTTLTPTQTGTTPGTYTVTVTGSVSGGSMQATTPVAVTVQ